MLLDVPDVFDFHVLAVPNAKSSGAGAVMLRVRAVMSRAAGTIISSSPRRYPTARVRVGARVGGGFSLIELLVVLFILCVLIGILLPAITRVRRSADSVNCVSNLRQIAL